MLLLSLAAPALRQGPARSLVPRPRRRQPLPARQPIAILPTALTGQTVGVLPITLVVADPALQSDSIYAATRIAVLAWLAPTP